MLEREEEERRQKLLRDEEESRAAALRLIEEEEARVRVPCGDVCGWGEVGEGGGFVVANVGARLVLRWLLKI